MHQPNVITNDLATDTSLIICKQKINQYLSVIIEWMMKVSELFFQVHNIILSMIILAKPITQDAHVLKLNQPHKSLTCLINYRLPTEYTVRIKETININPFVTWNVLLQGAYVDRIVTLLPAAIRALFFFHSKLKHAGSSLEKSSSIVTRPLSMFPSYLGNGFVRSRRVFSLSGLFSSNPRYITNSTGQLTWTEWFCAILWHGFMTGRRVKMLESVVAEWIATQRLFFFHIRKIIFKETLDTRIRKWKFLIMWYWNFQTKDLHIFEK